MTPSVLTWTELWPEGAASHEWSHSGAAVLRDGRFAFAEPGGAALVLLEPASGRATRVALPTADAHGIALDPAERGTGDGDVLWIADPGPDTSGGQVLRLDLATGETSSVPVPRSTPTGAAPWRPTSTARVAEGANAGDLWIADGYGASLVHVVHPDGSSATFDGAATGLAFDCPHGVTIDDRQRGEPFVVVADRNNRRLVVLDLDGALVRVIQDPLLQSPSSLAVRGQHILVTELNGALLAVDLDDRVAAIVPHPAEPRGEHWPNTMADGRLSRPALESRALHSPHGIAVGPTGDVYLTEWMIGGRQLRLTLTDEGADR